MSDLPALVHLDLERGWRGGQRQLELLLTALAREGVRSTVIARRGEDAAARYARIPGTRVLEARGRIGALRLARGVAGPRIYHAHTAATTPLAVLARRAGDVALATRRLDRPATAFWLKRLDRAVAISASVETSLRAVGLPPPPLVRIPSAVDLTRALAPGIRDELRARCGIDAHAPLGLTVGALEPQKDPVTLAKALGRTSAKYHHVWVGGGSLREAAAAAARDAGAEGRLHFAGFDPDPDRWFAAADLFVLPSVHEGLGTVLLDAFYFGVPVVGTRIPGTAELLEEGRSALLAEPGDPSGLARAVMRLAGDAGLGAALAAEGRRRVAGYGIEATAAAYLDLYRELAGAARR